MKGAASSLPEDFNAERYRLIYDDLSHLTHEQLAEHWLMHGKAEGRRYSGSTRQELIMAGRGPEDIGLEIAPYFRPLAPKRLGYNVKVVDVFPKEELRKKAAGDPAIPNNLISAIEDVDFIGSAGDLRQLLEKELEESSLDYIVSSHNFEHLPNPVQFLIDSQYFLAPDGVLSMAIPDLRCCFDFFQWPTMIDEWLCSYLNQKPAPEPSDIFRMRCREVNNFGYLGYPKDQIFLVGDLADSFNHLTQRMAAGRAFEYVDAHCSFFTPTSFRLLVRELRFLGIITLDIVNISGPVGNEFFVQLASKPLGHADQDAKLFDLERQKLLFDLISEIAVKAEPTGNAAEYPGALDRDGDRAEVVHSSLMCWIRSLIKSALPGLGRR
jgi:SAM-dependent methyltransferase